ncbi:hypothetical protein [Neogemmobacter tilapiae]|uniref:Uncharacterized protein n=1 Tax=Neogemmobacter tilapiae TaxID=875041 RepID=A0A918WPJ9_9RHOB|nr:hypothetical protein [Gemmobacter tilapiae]GHC65775.1 hypothetical protein GCM10007315_32970 [Gemmobacter tilapiae]
MNIGYLLSSLGSALTFALHVWGGGPEFLEPFLTTLSDPRLRAMSVILWHAVSLGLGLQAMAMLWLARNPSRPLGLFIAAGHLGWAALFLIVGQTMLGTVWDLMQWTIFLVLTGLSLWGALTAPARPAG